MLLPCKTLELSGYKLSSRQCQTNLVGDLSLKVNGRGEVSTGLNSRPAPNRIIRINYMYIKNTMAMGKFNSTFEQNIYKSMTLTSVKGGLGGIT